MLKVRITFANSEELKDLMEDIERDYIILNKSRVYSGRGESKYSNIYLDIEKK